MHCCIHQSNKTMHTREQKRCFKSQVHYRTVYMLHDESEYDSNIESVWWVARTTRVWYGS